MGEILPPPTTTSFSPLLFFSLQSFLCLVLSCLKECQWLCLSLCGQLCHRWSITTGGSLLLGKPRGPDDLDKSAINASPQPNALIGSDRHSGPYASFLPPRPQKNRCRQVCVRVVFQLYYSAPAVGGLCHQFLLPCSLSLRVHILWVSCVWERSCV